MRVDPDTGELLLSAPFVRSPYNYDRDAVSRETGLRCDDESLTKQSFKDECDINTIVRQFGLTGQLPDNIRVPEYRDYDVVLDYHTAMNAVRDAQEGFMMLPGELRARFHNDPQNLLAFCADPANYDEAVKLGIAVKRPDSAAVGAPVSDKQGIQVPPAPKAGAGE